MTRDEIIALLPIEKTDMRGPVQQSGYFAGLTEEEACFYRHSQRWGEMATVSKIKRYWWIWSGKTGHGLFKTKREAVVIAERYFMILNEKRRDFLEAGA